MGKAKKQITRRDFLKKSGIAAGAVGASTLIPGYHVNAADPIRIGMTPDLTGVLASFGFWLDRSAKAATARINKAGGIGGRELEFIVEDTESKAPTGVRKTRKLIQRDKVDFVIGSHHSGICLATNPIFKELKTIGFPNGSSTLITGAKGNSYVFRMNESVLHEVSSASDWAITQGKRWTLLGLDYAWGQDQCNQWAKRVKALGGKAVDIIMVPLGTDNMVPYLSRIKVDQTDVIFMAFFSASAIAFVKQASNMGIFNKFKYVGTYDSVEGLDPSPFEGAFYHTPFPQRSADVPAAIKPYDKMLRATIGVDAEGTDKKRGTPSGVAHDALGWENIHLLKDAVEATGYKNKQKHTRDVIKWLQGHETKTGTGYPQGGKLIRAKDHQAFAPIYIQQVVDGNWKVRATVPMENGFYKAQGNWEI